MMWFSKRFRALLLASALVAGACAGGGPGLELAREGVLPRPIMVEEASAARRRVNLEVFDAVWRAVDRAYYDARLHGLDWDAVRREHRPRAEQATSEAELYAALNQMLALLDDNHTNVTSPSTRARDEVIRVEGAVASYGLQLQRHGEVWMVEQVYPNSPAEAAGVLVGWRIVSVDGAPFGRHVLAADGREDQVVFEDEDGRRIEKVLRGALLTPPPRREARVLPDGGLYLRFARFDQSSLVWVHQAINLRDEPPAYLVLDLRHNGGGLLSVLGRVAGLISAEQSTPYAVLHGRLFNQRLMTASGQGGYRGPLYILIGPGSASASELLAAWAQETDRGLVVGQPSHGSVIASQDFNLPDGGELSLSIRDIRTGRGVRLEKVGVTPDLVIAPTLAQRRAGEDPVLQTVIARATGGG
ncbi:S41 family peptidase [Brevundimonas sp. 2R-24]|uniref:S41 family peptidase n=1 Tax=Peiella sedimenti TaxID=3061083 RepID=A0ABT8SME1_9CAUL|nr:S41 family peptidase [Caulobacteraceae bacterium XZ-24]